MALTVACVWTGSKYGAEYVSNLRAMVRRHLPVEHEFVCLTDQPSGAYDIDVRPFGLDGWWNKMVLFAPLWRTRRKIIYFDLDTVVCGDLSPLIELNAPFSICSNFARAAGAKTPCMYGSCLMVLGENLGPDAWLRFRAGQAHHMQKAGQLGDQRALEWLLPGATIIQEKTPRGFFLNYRNLRETKPPETSVVVFGGSHRPDNTEIEWVRDCWRNQDV